MVLGAIYTDPPEKPTWPNPTWPRTDIAILISYGHRPDRCARCKWALEMMSDHAAPTSSVDAR